MCYHFHNLAWLKRVFCHLLQRPLKAPQPAIERIATASAPTPRFARLGQRRPPERFREQPLSADGGLPQTW
jgi:hypothetical protein